MAANSADGIIYESVMQSDGKIVIGGSFSSYNFVGRNRIARINPDGTLDTSFDPGAGIDDGGYIGVEAVALQLDGKIVVAGNFSAYDGVARKNIARINSDGSLDTSFDSGIGANETIRSLAVQSDGKIIVGGDFTTYAGLGRNSIVRLNSDGSVDTSFNPGSGFSALVSDIAIQSDGKIIIAGEFFNYNGVARNNIVRINYDGSIDTTFDPGFGFDQQARTISMQSDGKIIVGGGFASYNGVARNRIVRLNTDGSLDTSFNPGTGANFYVIGSAIQPDGKILIGGNFTIYNGVFPINGIVRLNADGSRDTSFNTGSGANNFVDSIIIQSDASIFLSGHFTSFGGFNMGHVARVSSTGVLDTEFGLPDPPSVTTDVVTNINISSATGNGVIVDTGGEPVERFIEWGTSSGNYTGSCGAGQGDVGNYSCNMYGLASNTTYYVRAGAQNSGGTSYGEETTFVSNISPLITQDPTDIAANSAWGNAMLDITCDGEDDPAECSMIFDQYIEWGTTSGQYWEGSCYAGSGNVGVFGCGIDNLEPNTTYYVRAMMDSGGETPVVFYGNEVSFQTTAGLSVVTNAAENVTSTTAILGGNITNDGGEETMGRWIEVGTSSGEYYETSCDAGSGGVGTFSCEVTDLAPGTTYYYRAAASGDGSGGGGAAFLENLFIKTVHAYYEVFGEEMTFTTSNGGEGDGGGGNTCANALSGPVAQAVTQSDGKTVIVGWFNTYMNISRNFVARINSDGSLDTSFDPGIGTDAFLSAVALDNDGKILIGGGFSTYDGVTVSGITRLNADGSLDTTFNDGEFGTDSSVESIAVQPDGKILIGGVFRTYNGVTRDYLARLNADGSLDTSFDSYAEELSEILAIAVQPNGKILIGGNFDTYDGVLRNHIARLNVDGSLDTSFDPGFGTNDTVFDLTLDGDGKILVGGYFTTYDGTTANRIARLNTDGSLDTSFDPGSAANDAVEDIFVQSDAKIVIGGRFTAFDGVARMRVARLNSDGSLDITLDSSDGFDDWVYAVVPQSGGKIFVAGFMHSYGGSITENIALINDDGSLDASFAQDALCVDMNTTNQTNLNLTVSENLTLNCGSNVDLDNGITLTAGTPQTNTTTCQVTTNDQSGYNLSLTDDRGTNNALYHTTNSATQDGQIQDKIPWNVTSPNAQVWTGTGLGFGILSSTATKNTTWWGNAINCNDTNQRYAGLPDTDTNIMEYTSYNNTHTDTTICYKLDIPSTQLSGEYEGSVTYTAAGRP